MLIVECGLTAVTVAAGFCFPRTCGTVGLRVERALSALARRRSLAVLTVGLTAIVLRLATLPLNPIPQPFIHDEFSYLLAGDTFAHGTLTNPTHPMWQHFESFHIDQQPAYMSMYPPAQGMILAAGERFAADPWYGVAVSAALMCAAVCWMLQGWLPAGWALLGGAMAVMRLALFSYWVNSYYGGAAAAIGGALVFGSLPRILRAPRMRHGILMACGAMILANSRPWEGLLVCLPVAAALVWWVTKKEHPPMAVLARCAAPAVVLLLGAGVFMGYYNSRNFGSPWTLPYQLNRATYASAPVFLWQSPRPEPVYRHRVMREFYSRWEMGDFLYAKTPAGFLSRTAQKAGIVYFFVCGPALSAPLFFFPFVVRSRRLRFLCAAGLVFVSGLVLNAWLFPHYIAPFLAAFYVFLLECMRRMRAWKPGGVPYGRAIVRLTPVLCVALAGIRLFAAPLGITIPRFPTMWYGTEPLGLPRAAVVRRLESCPGKQLAIVHYEPKHSVFDDWVYNGAEIDNAHTVWAREMGGPADAALLRYFHDRTVWLVEPDADPPRLTLYAAHAASGVSRISRCR